jgi:hypothetical protein
VNEADDGSITQEFTTAEFAVRLGLPPGTVVTSIGMIWFDWINGQANNTVRVRYRPDMVVRPLLPELQVPLEHRLRRLAAKWRAQAHHPQRRDKPEESKLLGKHADELLRVLSGKPDEEEP